MKTCTRCNASKPESDFGKHARANDGLRPACKVCHNKSNFEYRMRNGDEVRARARVRSKAYRAKPENKARIQRWNLENKEKNKAKDRVNRLKNKYRISEEDYNKLLEKQNGVCAICKGLNRLGLLCVDHDHRTGAVRGLLCRSCNTAIGQLKDDPALILVAHNYLINWQAETRATRRGDEPR